MERPAKRMKISNPDVRNPRDTGSRMTEGLFTSEQGIRGGEPGNNALPTRTISLSEFQRRNRYGDYEHMPKAVVPRRNPAGIYLLPRAPDETVTASVIEVNVNDGTTTSKVTEVPAATTGTVVSLSDVGSVTVPGISDVTDPPTITDSLLDTITQLPSDSTAALNGTTTLSDTTEERTVTVTATSTFEVSLINGTVIATTSFLDSSSTHHESTRTTRSSSSTSDEWTFGQMTTTSTSSEYGSGYDGSPTGYYTGVAGADGQGSPTAASSSSATSDSGSGSGSGGPGLTPRQQTVVGGVVGGVAGVALALAIVLFVLRWYRRRLKARGELPEQIAARELAGGTGPSYPMSQRSSTVPFAAAVAQNLRRLRPHSNQTLATTATGATDPSVGESERGFQRIAGRKIAPVLGSGADPYGGNYGAFEKETGTKPADLPNNGERGLSGASFYRDSQGFYGGDGSSSPTFPPSPTTAATSKQTGEASSSIGPTSNTRDFARPYVPAALNTSQLSLNSPSKPEGIAVMRPSPARTPVTLSPAPSSVRLPIQQPPTLDDDAPPMPVPVFGVQRDGVGRSLASQDGSRVSKSSGKSAGRFMENV